MTLWFICGPMLLALAGAARHTEMVQATWGPAASCLRPVTAAQATRGTGG
ncbi:hypothetical protein FIU94_15475 [Sulfitobacter sp. THAF37]|nr:hypothetical protein [Sulfitobacter sp. THAF37]QFT60227.1 hypothetical protein FIU94_15475 [Sulfitobacter sp. THAF37]